MYTTEIILAYLGVFALAVVTAIGVPGPGDGALVAAGIAAAEGSLDLTTVLGLGFAGGVLGCQIGYQLGCRHGRKLLEGQGPFPKFRRSMLHKGAALLLKYPRLASLAVPSVVCGIFRVKRWTFVIFSTISRLWWALSTTLVAYYFGEGVTEFFHRATRAPTFWIIAILAVLVMAIRYAWVQRSDRASDEPAAL